MDLNTLWFVLVAVLFCGFFVAAGFDFGVGILLPLVADTDAERRRVLDTIGPVWHANAAWILAAGVAMSAAFPHWTAALWSGFRVVLVFAAVAMIARGVVVERRGSPQGVGLRRGWEWAVLATSLVLSVLSGLVMGNLLAGVPIDAKKQFVGDALDLVSPYTLVCGLASLGAFVTHGALFLHLASTEPIRHRAMSAVRSIGPVATMMILLFVVATYYWTDAFSRLHTGPRLMLPLAAFSAMLGAGAFVHLGRVGWAFLMTSVAMAASTATIFLSLYPRVMVSSLNPEWSLTIGNSGSTPSTLRIVLVACAIALPLVLGWQARAYRALQRQVPRTMAQEP